MSRGVFQGKILVFSVIVSAMRSDHVLADLDSGVFARRTLHWVFVSVCIVFQSVLSNGEGRS